MSGKKNDMAPKVSIIVTCYNYGKYVAGCLESVKKQSFQDYEVIIVDDGSIDDSEQKIRPFLSDSRFMYVKQRNGGQANAKNRGIKESVGEFIAFLDADDMWVADKLEKQMVLFADSQVGVVYSRVENIDENGVLLSMEEGGEFLTLRSGKVTSYLFYDNFVPFSSTVIRRICFEIFGGFDESLAMGIDWDLWLRFSTEFKFDYVDEPFLLYRVGHSGQMSKNLPERIRCADRIIEKFLVTYPDEVSIDLQKDARYYSCCVRGNALRQFGFAYSIKYFGQGIVLFPLRREAYLGLIKAVLKLFVGL